MSREFDAKNATLKAYPKERLKAYPEDRGSAEDLFIGYLDMDKKDIERELGQTIEEYLDDWWSR